MEPREINREQIGLYYSTVIIPPNLLAEGEYSVGISIFASRGVKSRYVFEKDSIVFQVTDSMTGNSARGDYAERFAGVVRPLLQWQMHFDGSMIRCVDDM
jgi:lipopolysaccharide transport system ATP-binding protein